jgi:hypothetical protein
VSGVSIPMAVRDRLGSEATLGLIDVLESERAEVIQMAADRFERRLALEVSSLRLELHDGLAGVRQEMATTRVELLKWSFAFWIGQVAAMAGLLAFMLRAAGR